MRSSSIFKKLRSSSSVKKLSSSSIEVVFHFLFVEIVFLFCFVLRSSSFIFYFEVVFHFLFFWGSLPFFGTDMGLPDNDSDILSPPIFLPIPIYLHQYIGHRYRYRYFQFGQYFAENCYFGRYMPIFWPMSMYFKRYLADIQSSRYHYHYRYDRYRYPFCQYRYIGIGQKYRLTDISVQPLHIISVMWLQHYVLPVHVLHLAKLGSFR